MSKKFVIFETQKQTNKIKLTHKIRITAFMRKIIQNSQSVNYVHTLTTGK